MEKVTINDILDDLKKFQKGLLLQGECRLLKNVVLPKEICQYHQIKPESRLILAYMGHSRVFDDTYYYLICLEDQGATLFEGERSPEEIETFSDECDSAFMDDGLVSFSKKVERAVKFEITWENSYPQAKNVKNGNIIELSELPKEEPVEETMAEQKTGSVFFDLQTILFGNQNILVIAQQSMEPLLVYLYKDGSFVCLNDSYHFNMSKSGEKLRKIIADHTDDIKMLQRTIALLIDDDQRRR